MKQDYKPIAGAVYAVYVEPLKRFGAYQILEVNRGSIGYIVLDYMEPEPPTEEMLSDLQPLYRERYRYHHVLDMRYIDQARVPADYIYIGTCSPVTDKPCCSYAGNKWDDGDEYMVEMYWQQGDERQKENFKKYMTSGEWVSLPGGSFKKWENTLTMELYEAADGKFSIELFPCITNVHMEGPDSGILGAIADATLILDFHWNAPRTEVLDLRNIRSRIFTIDGTGVKKIFLPDSAVRLCLIGELQPELQIIGEIRVLTIKMESTRVFPYGLSQISRLSLHNVDGLDLAEFPVIFPELRSLTLTGKPGVIKNLDILGRLPALRHVSIWDLFGFAAEDIYALEKLSGLEYLDLGSIPKEAGLAARKIWKGKLGFLSVKKLRADDWLKENLENPFRHWDGSEFVPAGAYKLAMQQYKRTRKQLEQAKTREEAVAAVKEYGECFNRLNKRYDQFIETDEREDLFLVLEQLHEEFLKDKGLIHLNDFLNILDEMREEW